MSSLSVLQSVAGTLYDGFRSPCSMTWVRLPSRQDRPTATSGRCLESGRATRNRSHETSEASPSPLVSVPRSPFVDFSTENSIRPVRIRAKLPSTCNVSSLRSIRITSSAGTGDSKTQIPFPLIRVWNSPSPPNRADDTFFCNAEPMSRRPLAAVEHPLVGDDLLAA